MTYSVDLADFPRTLRPIDPFRDPPIMPKSSPSASTTAKPCAHPPSRTLADIELGEIPTTMQHRPSATTPGSGNSNGNGNGNGNGSGSGNKARTTSFLRAVSLVDVFYLFYVLNALGAFLAVSIYAGVHARGQDATITISKSGPYLNTDGSIPYAAAWIAAWAATTVVAGHSVAVLQAVANAAPRPGGRYSDSGFNIYQGFALPAGWLFAVLIVVVGVCAYL